jgi:hypothetical protein
VIQFMRLEVVRTPLPSHTRPIAGQNEMEAPQVGRTGMVFSIIAFVAGAIMYWAVTSQPHGFRLSTVGVILMIAGAVGLVTSLVVFGMSRRPARPGHHTYDREATDSEGRSTALHEEVR